MPRRSPEQRLRDILAAIEKIRRYTAEMDFAAFAAVRRHPDVPWAEMRGLRNIVIHEYFGVSLAILWETIQHDLPQAEASLSALLSP